MTAILAQTQAPATATQEPSPFTHPAVISGEAGIRYQVLAFAEGNQRHIFNGEQATFDVTMPYHLRLDENIERLLQKSTGKRWLVLSKQEA